MPSAIEFFAFDVFSMFFMENAFYGLFKFTKNDRSSFSNKDQSL